MCGVSKRIRTPQTSNFTIRLSNKEIQCRTPTHQPQTVSVSVTFEQEEIIGVGISYTFFSDPTIQSIYPKTGTFSRNTLLYISGQNFDISHNIKCIFGTDEEAATLLSSSILTCKTPIKEPNMVTGDISLSIYDSSTNVQWPKYPFSYFDVPIAESLSVASGTVSGVDRIIIKGKKLNETGRAFCRYSYLSDSTQFHIVEAKVIEETRISCGIPEDTVLKSENFFHIDVSNNQLDWSMNRLMFKYVPDLLVLKVTPSKVTITGGTIITIHGMGFADLGDITCMFGNDYLVHGKILSDSEQKW